MMDICQMCCAVTFLSLVVFTGPVRTDNQMNQSLMLPLQCIWSKVQSSLDEITDKFQKLESKCTGQIEILQEQLNQEREERLKLAAQLNGNIVFNKDLLHQPAECTSCGRKYNGSFSQKTQLRGQSIKLYNTSKVVHKVSLVNSQLWVFIPNENSIYILTKSGIQINILTFENIKPLAVGHCGDDIVLCSSGGLFMLNAEGRIHKELIGGYFTDIDMENQTAVVYEYNNNKVLILSHMYENFVITSSFEAEGTDMSIYNTIMLINSRIYVCGYRSSNINIYSMSGVLEDTIGTKGTESAGQLKQPLLCLKDRDATLIVCDYGNKQLQMAIRPDVYNKHVRLSGANQPHGVMNNTVVWHNSGPLKEKPIAIVMDIDMNSTTGWALYKKGNIYTIEGTV